MSDDMTARLRLPTIRPGQAQKESSHNEALTLIDVLAQASALAFGVDLPPSAPVAGQNWVVGSTPSDAWAGHAGQLAAWTEGGWRFVVPVDGMSVWIIEALETARYSGGAWVLGEVRAARLVVAGKAVVGARRSAIGDPSGGSVTDLESRAAIVAILGALRGHGLIAP